MNEMEIDSIRVSLENYQRVVILKQKEGDRYLLIWIGTHEAEAIAVRLQEVQVPRPLTHDLLHNSIKELGGAIEKITISGLENDTYFARIGVRVGEKTVEIDSRPSDALAIAVRAKVPIFVEDEVIHAQRVELFAHPDHRDLGEPGVFFLHRSGPPGPAAHERRRRDGDADLSRGQPGPAELQRHGRRQGRAGGQRALSRRRPGS